MRKRPWRLHKAVAAMLPLSVACTAKTPPDPPRTTSNPQPSLSDTTPDSEDKPLPVFTHRKFGDSGAFGAWRQFAGHCQGMMVPNTGAFAHSEADLLRLARCAPSASSGVGFVGQSILIVDADFFGNKSHQLSFAGVEDGVVLLDWQTSRPCQGVAPSPPHACTVLDPTPPSAEPQHSLHVCGKGLFGVEVSREFLNKIDRGPIPVQELKVSIRQVPSQPCPGGIP